MITPATATARIEFALGIIDEALLERLSSVLAGASFPILEADLDKGELIVDASSDPDDYSVLMAASAAALAVGIDENNVLYAEVQA